MFLIITILMFLTLLSKAQRLKLSEIADSLVHASELPHLGSGHRATVYKIGMVAVKVQSNQKDSQRELQIVKRLKHAGGHQNICPFTGLSGETEDGLLWMAFDVVEGPMLRDLIKKSRRKGKNYSCSEIERQLWEAIDFMHSAGVCHGDIDPSNIILVDREYPVLVDFGEGYLTSKVDFDCQSQDIECALYTMVTLRDPRALYDYEDGDSFDDHIKYVLDNLNQWEALDESTKKLIQIVRDEGHNAGWVLKHL